jgi:hypothetical protein
MEKFNKQGKIKIQDYLNLNISWHEKHLMASLRTNSQRLQCEIGRWEKPNELWEERLCMICGNGEVEIKQHFLFHCTT